MLLRLILLRLGPLAALHFCKGRKTIKKGFVWIVVIYGGLFLMASWKIFSQKGWSGIMLLPISMFPQYLCYGFAVWILMRCIWSAWSDRVWRRIYSLSVFSVVLGILTENYWNPEILQFFCKIFNNFFGFT